MEALREVLLQQVGFVGDGYNASKGWALNARQNEAMLRAEQALGNLVLCIEDGWPVDVWAVPLREALKALQSVAGGDATEDVLSSIFSTFCVGK